LSSILRALKRIEKEAPPPDESHPWPREIDTKKTITSRVKRRWLYNKLIKILVIIIIVAVAGWLIFSQRQWIIAKIMPAKPATDSRQQSGPAKEKDSAHRAKINAQPSRPKKTPQKSSPIPNKQHKKPTFQRKTKSPVSTEPVAGALSQNEQKQPQGAVQPLPVVKKKPLIKKRQPVQLNQPSGSTTTPNQRPTTMTSKGSSAKKMKKPGAKNNFDSLNALDGSQLKLQAIAWSKDVSRRMVVINNRVIREGETVDGFSITKIRLEDVIVTDGTNSWRLEFSLKQ
jgi:cytoskeletal protein RodZ